MNENIIDELFNAPKMTSVDAPTLSNLAIEKRKPVEYTPGYKLPYMTYLDSDDEDDKPEDIYDPRDFAVVGQRIRDNVVKAIEKRFPVVGDKYTLKVENLHYEKPKNTTLKEMREIMLNEGSLVDRLKGDWVLYDNASGMEMQRKSATMLNVPRMTPTGVFIRNGSEIGLKNMFRLRPGVYTRIKNNGEVVTHINPEQTTGRQCSVTMDHNTGIMTLVRGTRTYGVLPMLRAAGMSDDVIKKAWGEELFNTNAKKYADISKGTKIWDEYKELWDTGIAPIKLDPVTTKDTLGFPAKEMSSDVLLTAANKVLKVSHTMSEDDVDDRDSLQFQRVMGPADYIPERIVRDGGGLLRNLFNQVTRNGNLDAIETGAFQPQVDAVFMDDKHAGYIDGSSPVEAFDFAASISRLGEGGIGSVDAAPAETRGVQDSYAGFIDPIRSPESLKTGLDLYLSYGVKKGASGKLYNHFRDKTGKISLVSMDKTSRSIVTTPEFWDPNGDPEEYIPAFYKGKQLDYVKRKDVDYYIANSNYMMSVGAGMIPLLGGIRSNRTLMGCLHPDTMLEVRYTGSKDWCLKTADAILKDDANNFEIITIDSEYNGAVEEIRGIHKVTDFNKLYKVSIQYLMAFHPGLQLKPPHEGRYASVIVTDNHKWFTPADDPKKLDVVTTEELFNEHKLANIPGRTFVKHTEDPDSAYYSDIVSFVVSVEEYTGPRPEYVIDIDVDDKAYMLANGMFTHNSKYGNQALPLEQRESPLVQRKMIAEDGTETTTEKFLGASLGAKFSPVKGRVLSVDQDEMIIRGTDGKKYTVELYHDYPANQKGFLSNTPVVKVGDVVDKGQAVAKSNYTDDKGEAALGVNLRVAYLNAPNSGTFEDGITISESAAKKLASEQLYKVRGETTDDVEYSKQRYLSLFKDNFTEEQLSKIGDDGLPKVGAVFHEGDPVYLGVQKRDIGVHGISRNAAVPYLHLWGHSAPGTVTDVVKGRKHLTVYTKAYTPMEVGDKMCYDDKTQVLTKRGWKYFKDLDGTEEVFTLDYKTGETRFSLYADKFSYHHKGLMYGLETPDLSICVTDNHEHLVAAAPDPTFMTKMKSTEIIGKKVYHFTGTDITNPRKYACSKVEGAKEGWVKYDGYVYCVDVPYTHTLYVKRNGKCWWSGNSGRYGSKGVVAQILPDSEMPQDSEGRPFEVLQSPLGLPSRINTSQLVEAGLGKLGQKTGKTYALPDFISNESIIDYVDKEMKANGMEPDEDLTDPVSGKTIPKVQTGVMFYYKLKHMSELKERGRGTGDYSSEEVPLKGEGAARRLGAMEVSAVFSGGGIDVLRDAKILRGQRNDEFWAAYRAGKYPETPGIPLVHKKFFAHLQAAGVHIEDRADRLHIYGATDQNIKDLTGNRKVSVAATFASKDLQPISGGLFDPNIFGADGDQWGYIDLPEPVMNPLMSKTIGTILGWKDKELNEYLSGERNLKEQYGTDNLMEVLSKVDLEKELKAAKSTLKAEHTTLAQRDLARKRIRAIEPMIREGKKPQDFFFTRMPVLPPRFRAVSAMSNGVNIAADANFLYKRLMDAAEDMKAAKEKLPPEMQLDARKSLYKATGALVGVLPTDDPKLEAKGVAGVLKWAFGKSSPKLSSTHRKVFGANLDLGSLSTVVPDNKLSIDQVGIPEKSAWKMFEPFVLRKLSQRGYSMIQGLNAVLDHTPEAKEVLLEVMKERPVLLNRAPTLWRYGIMGYHPVLVKDNAIHVNTDVCKGMNMDFDGDTVLTSIRIAADRKNLENIFKKALTNTEFMLYYIHDKGNNPKNNKKESCTMLQNGVEVVGSIVTPIENIPVIESSMRKIANNVTEWDVDGDYYVNSINKETGKAELAKISKVSKHENLQFYDVQLEARDAYRHVLTCTSDKTLITYSDEGELKITDTKDAVGRVVPRLHEGDNFASTETIQVKYIQLGDRQYALSYDFGLFLGMMIGDGWVDTNNQARLAAECPQIQDEMLRVVKDLDLPHSQSGDAQMFAYDTERFGSDVAHRINLHLRKDLSIALGDAIGHGAYNKRVPLPCMSGSRAHILGLLIGLIATDGNVAYNPPAKGKKTASKGIFFHTTSTTLRDNISAICRRLGIRCSVTPYRGVNSKVDCYMVMLCLMDVAKVYKQESKFRMIANSDQEDIERIVEDISRVEIDEYDIVPFPKHLRTAMTVAGFGAKDENGKLVVFAKTEPARYAAKGYVTRALALKMVEQFRKTDWSNYKESTFIKPIVHYTPDTIKEAVERWCSLVEDRTIDWEYVKAVTERQGLETGWDITVPGPLTFTTCNGTFVQDSATTHVPVSNEAIEAINKNMLPSKNLLSPTNYKAHYIPRAEMAEGLYLASRDNNRDKAVHFKSKEDMLAAYKKGLIKVDTPVIIG